VINSVNKFVYIFFFTIVLLHAEYGADNTSYTATNKRSIVSMKYKIEQQEERLDGLTTIIEGFSASLYELQNSQQKKELLKNSQNNNEILLQKLVAMIDDINTNYVSKQELKNVLEEYKVNKKVESVKIKNRVTKGKENAILYREAVRHFGKQRYDEAEKRFTVTDKNNYKPAASNYYLGEISYYTKKYDDAIFYFKKSAGLYDKASYIDTLLFHSAVSLERIGKIKEAKIFYKNIIENYPTRKTAKIAKKKLANL